MRDDDFNWLVEHGPEIVRDHAGKWIAVRDGAVIGVGDTATEAAQAAHEKASGGNFILEAVNAETDVIYHNGRPSSANVTALL